MPKRHAAFAASPYALSKRGYYADFVLVPVATMIAVAWLLTLHPVHPIRFASSVIVGVIVWTFIEYGVHRWIFHGLVQAKGHHMRHHVQDAEYIGFSSRTTVAIGAILFWALTCFFGACIGVGLLVGLVSGYMTYILLHDRFHHANLREGSILHALKKNHDYHHKRAKVNFGVTSPVWDVIFDTFQRSPR